MPQSAELIEREQRDVRVAIVGGGHDATRTRIGGVGCADRRRCAAPRAARSARHRASPARQHARPRRRTLRGRRGRRAAARIASRRTCASGSSRHRAQQRLIVDAAPSWRALRARDGGRARRSTDSRGARRRHAGAAARPRRRRAGAACGASARALRALSRRRADRSTVSPRAASSSSVRSAPSTCVARRVRQAADRFADRRADVGLGFDFQPRDERRRPPRRSTAAAGGPCSRFQPCAACPMALAASARISGSGCRSDGMMSAISAGRSSRPSARTRDARRSGRRRCARRSG